MGLGIEFLHFHCPPGGICSSCSLQRGGPAGSALCCAHLLHLRAARGLRRKSEQPSALHLRSHQLNELF